MVSRPKELLSIQTGVCHCGNVTESGVFRIKPPSEKSKRPCCLLCRCDECGYGTKRTASGDAVDYRPTDELPGCGPFCIYHDDKVRQKRMSDLKQRISLNYREHM